MAVDAVGECSLHFHRNQVYMDKIRTYRAQHPTASFLEASDALRQMGVRLPGLAPRPYYMEGNRVVTTEGLCQNLVDLE